MPQLPAVLSTPAACSFSLRSCQNDSWCRFLGYRRGSFSASPQAAETGLDLTAAYALCGCCQPAWPEVCCAQDHHAGLLNPFLADAWQLCQPSQQAWDTLQESAASHGSYWSCPCRANVTCISSTCPFADSTCLHKPFIKGSSNCFSS